jgi:hypothetical protein
LRTLCCAYAGSTNAIATLGALTALAALIPTLSASVRSVPRPVVRQAELSSRTPVLAAVDG